MNEEKQGRKLGPLPLMKTTQKGQKGLKGNYVVRVLSPSRRLKHRSSQDHFSGSFKSVLVVWKGFVAKRNIKNKNKAKLQTS